MDDIQKRIEILDRISEASLDLASITKKLGVESPNEICASLAAIRTKYTELGESMSRKLSIAVAGKFSCGKSQFINSLIGREIAPVGSERMTCCTTIFTGDTSLTEISITDSHNTAYSIEEYARRSARASANGNVFIVRLPARDWPGWEDFEVVDTPGYDSPDAGDRQISEEAVAKADVVFFLFDIGNGTIPKDSVKYLKDSINSRSLLYLVANKADLKSEGAQQTILNSISDECGLNEIKYECVLPYSSLMPWSKELLRKNERARANVIARAERLKDNAIGVIEGLVERARVLDKPRIEKSLHNADGCLAQCVDDAIRTAFSVVENVKSTVIEQCCDECQTLCEKIVSILQDSAVDCTEKNGSNLVRSHKLEGTGWFVCDWAVYLAKSANEYDLVADDRESLGRELEHVLAPYGLWTEELGAELIDLRKQCAISVIDQLRINDESAPVDDEDFFRVEAFKHSDFCRICDYESERRGCEDKILAKLNGIFPAAFAKIADPKVKEILLGPALGSRLKDLYGSIVRIQAAVLRMIELSSVVKRGAYSQDDVRAWLDKMGVLLSPTFGTVHCKIKQARQVSVGETLVHIKKDSGSGEAVIIAPRFGTEIMLVEDGRSVSLLDPVVAVCPLNERMTDEAERQALAIYIAKRLTSESPGDRDTNLVTSANETSGASTQGFVTSPVSGCVDTLIVSDGSQVKKGDLLLWIGTCEGSFRWPVRATQSGRVRFNVWFGKCVNACDLVAVISD